MYSRLFTSGKQGHQLYVPQVSDCARLNNSISDYRRALMGSVPGLGQLLLRHCLEKVHKDIITCWNFKGEVLNYWNFRLHWLDLCTHR